MHAHFSHAAAPETHDHGPELEAADDDDHAAIWSVDSFTLVANDGLAPFIPSEVAAELPVALVPVAWVDVVEERGHDPPLTDRSIPRAPPS